MRAVVLMALVAALSACGGDDRTGSSSGETYTAEQVTEAFASVGWTFAPLDVDEVTRSSPLPPGQTEPDAILVRGDRDPARVIAFVWPTPGEAAKAAALEIEPIRRGNVVVVHYGDAGIARRIRKALDAL